MAKRPNVHVKVSPLDGRVLAGPGTFRLLTGDSTVPYIATAESLAGIMYLENPGVVEANGDCVELATDGQHVYVRDSKDPTGGSLALTADVWQALLSAAKAGELDHLA